MALACVSCDAQTSLKLPLDPAGITALQAKTKDGYDALGKIHALADYDKEMDQFPALIEANRDFVISDNGNANIVFAIGGLLKKNHPEPQMLAAQLARIDRSYAASVPAYAQAFFAARMASLLLKYSPYLAEAKRYALLSVALFNEDDCALNDHFDDASRALYDQKKSKTPLNHVYYKEDGAEHCNDDHAARFAILGEIEAKLGDTKEASSHFTAALAIHPNVDAYVGLATVDEAEGKKSQELRLLSSAYLTGRLDADHIAKAKALYLELNPGHTAHQYDLLLDAEYEKTASNPVKIAAAPALGSRRVVLDEFFTGADCEPCVASDLATEAALRRYSRENFVLVVYHNNAPAPDPLTNNVGEDRAKYYGTRGSTPHTFVDGKEIDLEEGLGKHAQSAYDLLSSTTDKALASPAESPIEVTATSDGQTVKVKLKASPERTARKVHLQVLLLEDPVSYSGRNELRFHPMVVRAGAGERPGTRGFALASATPISKEVIFDLDKVESENLTYYEESKQDLVKRLSALIASGGMDKKEVEKMGEFHEHKNLIDPSHLSVVAFLQDDATKNVLTATYVVVGRNQEVGTR